jgi:four helix bundle protein
VEWEGVSLGGNGEKGGKGLRAGRFGHVPCLPRVVPLRHHSLVAWQRADDLYIELHELTRKSFPAYERYELGSQLRRSAFSTAVNIVEGCAREHRAERLQFLNVSRASLAEVGYCLHVAHRLGYIDRKQLETFEVALNQVGAALSGFIRSIHDGRSV